ncbi:uncharacterized protein LOC123395908 [Hordeum vulgare subsp. vulgare]|uniref:Uncharacterized protein n=1 Tax=Hordeum vulgare subsp. vulgare TaxID=112509 RepID=M0Z4E4_HORVV|nr:uncharacterized protein LOC123395908 [Hordeum vulgare subsp. vulgare]KAI4990973.1 hypothetical protein ZWY2020_039344 [Hordeum vulgare]
MEMIHKGSMDLVLVPCGLAIMLGYHLLLLYRILRHPHTTVIGYENHNKLAWVQRMAQTTAPEETALALSVISDSISASTTLASLCIALGSLIGAWVSSNTSEPLTGAGQSATTGMASAKFTSLLVCFLASFACFIQSAGHYVHASFLMTALGSDAPASHVQRAVIRGGNFWALGLRALYFATALLMWVFGPVAMLACSVLSVAVLHLLDTSSMPLHHHQFLDRASVTGGARAATTPNPGLHSAVAVFSPASYLR